MSGLSASEVTAWLGRYRDALVEQAGQLTELDAAIGDGDHGINMERGFNAVAQRVLASSEGKDAGWILEQAGMTLLSTVGGAGGPLYGTLFMSMGQAAGGKAELDAAELVGALGAGVHGVGRRGRSEPGEKTMLDALVPALAAAERGLADGAGLRDSVAAAAAAAAAGCRATIPMKATKGRASYLGDRSIGHQDPGATSSALLLSTLLETLDAR